MQVHHTIAAWREHRGGKLAEAIAGGATVGFVPTMGALHRGHVSLLERASAECDIVVLSIFVNPTQFNDPGDLAAYPIALDDDLAVAGAAGCDHVLLPDAEQVYPDGYRYQVTEREFSQELCGAHRPGHFDGVLTVVMKLFQIVAPTRAYFGEKDFQQLMLVRDMAAAFFLPLDVVACPTVREDDGLAMSSRNRRLTAEGRALAPLFANVLRSAPTADDAALELKEAGFEVDYVVDRDERRFGAVFLDGVRLIDNVERPSRSASEASVPEFDRVGDRSASGGSRRAGLRGRGTQ